MPRKSCLWIEDEDGVWETQCGDAFEFYAEGPSENGMRFCCYCGRNLVDQKYTWKEQARESEEENRTAQEIDERREDAQPE